MTDAELAALEARMITVPATFAVEHADEPQADGDTDGSDTDVGQDGDDCADDAGELPDGDAGQDGDGCGDDEHSDGEAANT